MRPSEHNCAPYVGLVEKIEADNRNNVRVKVRWYYRPEEAVGGRRQFHGAKELFLSDHYDIQSAHTIEGKCIVHTFKNYTRLEYVGPEDYYCRFEYKPASGTFLPDRVAVYHPACVELTIEQAKQLDHFVCSDHDEDMKKPHKSPLANGKLDHFVCSDHDEDMKKPHITPLANGKLDHFVCSEHDEDMKKPYKTPLANGKVRLA
ncbi:hypothetical protein DH2020_008875 [Rehmannia glutinosa]|uniref:BAH domain-containing protein n=1 Tax=Rehmannia glutinosa TaxID=99300 RepID=A0ABR0X4N3_REHGL